MLRFPNPGSTIANFLSVYTAAFERLNGFVCDLDDIVAVVVAANLATSSGYMGSQAVARSTRPDRSRDPLYNQLKMYAELFRALGWLHPTEGVSLKYTFTLLGRQVIAAGRNYLPIFGESVLGISYPSHVLTIKGDFNLRPFAFILRTMLAAGGYLSRDEMIVGPLSATSDRSTDSAARLATILQGLRASARDLDDSLNDLATQRRTQVNTLHNYTRWPIAVLRDCGWVEKAVQYRRDRTRFEAFRLTAEGERIAQRVVGAFDVRLEQSDKLPIREKTALSLAAHYAMLGRAGFELAPVVPRLESLRQDEEAARQRLGIPSGQELLFSPFQSLSIPDIQAIFPSERELPLDRTAGRDPLAITVGRGSRDHLFVAPVLIPATASVPPAGADAVRQEILGLLKRFSTPTASARAFAELHASDTKTQFYPLISHLFQILGYPSDYSRAGVNYQRWDACVWIGNEAIPVEIKSPTEEVYLSTKAVRQALENKVVLLSRGGLTTKKELTSLIVGFKIPNERAEMSTLIDDVFHAYDLRIGVIDLENLVKLTARSLQEKVTISPQQLASLRGFLDV
jgi:hypothetical protein